MLLSQMRGSMGNTTALDTGAEAAAESTVDLPYANKANRMTSTKNRFKAYACEEIEEVAVEMQSKLMARSTRYQPKGILN